MVIRNSKSKRGQTITMTKRKRTKNDLQNITQKSKNRVTGTPLKTWGVLRCSGWIAVPAPHVSHIAKTYFQLK